jgi:hypothetical protein
MPHRLGPLAGGEQLQRADDVDLVKGGRRGAGLGVPEDPAVDDGLDPGGRQQAREHRVADVGVDELGASEGGRRGSAVDPEDVVDARIALESVGERGPPEARDGDDTTRRPAAPI